MRTIVAAEALSYFVNYHSWKVNEEDEDTYIAPIPKIKATLTLVRLFIFRFQTMKHGRIANIQSLKQLIALYAYVALTVICGSMHLPLPPVYCVQK